MFSQTVEYALRAMVQLAADSPAASTTKEIAAKTKVPSAYLAKVLQSMRRAGLIHSRRGVGGGVTLAEQPKDISLLLVIDAVEPLKRTRGKSRSAPTPLQRTLDQALVQVRETFSNVSLADMLSRRAPKKRKKAAARRRKKSAKSARRKVAAG
jgi:Rrf2 family transcriptional regulator, nitric oxide-sensitive transcriptional repressor